MESVKLGQIDNKMAINMVVSTGENIPKINNQIESKSTGEYRLQDTAPIRRILGFCALSCCSH